MRLRISSEPRQGDPPTLDYYWDEDTSILAARLEVVRAAERISQLGDPEVIQVAGSDGAWLHFELVEGCLAAIEVAIWPRVRHVGCFSIPQPAGVSEVRLRIEGSARPRNRPPNCLELPLSATSGADGRSVRFSFGRARAASVVLAARGLLVGVGRAGELSDIWLLNVPALPLLQNSSGPPA